MENKVDIREIAEYCRNEYQQKCEKSNYMCGYLIYYVAISADGKMKISQTPHILDGVDECCLIHKSSQQASTCWYETYDIQRINVDGEVEVGLFDDEYSFSIKAARFNTPEMISLKRNGHEIYCESLWSKGAYVLTKRLEYVWELYKKCKKECKTEYESELLCKLADKEESIKELEGRLAECTVKEQYLREQLSQYQTLLDDIKSTLKPGCQVCIVGT